MSIHPKLSPRALAAAAVIGLVLVVCALALWPKSARGGGDRPAPPGGAYLDTCRNVTTDGATVRAQCRTDGGDYVATELAYRLCEGGILNKDGKLFCYMNRSLTFQHTCESISWNAATLSAWCRRIQRGPIWNLAFDYNVCLAKNQDIANCDGTLKCGGC